MSFKPKPSYVSPSCEEDFQPKENSNLTEADNASNCPRNNIESSTVKDGQLLKPRVQNNSEQIFYVGMAEKDVKIKLFILEEGNGFDALKTREKYSHIIKRSSSQIQEWYYNQGVNNDLPKQYPSFKKAFIEKCSFEGLGNLLKFSEEKWSQFIKRLTNESKMKDLNEIDVIQKLRQCNIPRDLVPIFYTPRISLCELIGLVEEWESFIENRRNNKSVIQPKTPRGKGFRNKTSNSSTVRCYNCQEIGHYANKCQKRKLANRPHKKDGEPLNMSINGSAGGVEKDNVEINGFDYLSVFDSGSNMNIISQAFFEKLGFLKVTLVNKPQEIRLIDGSSVKSYRYTTIEVKYKGRLVSDRFYILRNCVVDLLIGKPMWGLFKDNKVKDFPIVCRIPTRGTSIVS